MNHCAVQQQQNAFSASEEMRSPFFVSVSTADRRETVVCPKPRRLGRLHGGVNDRPLRWLVSHQQELCESGAGTDLFDIILPKGGYGDQSFTQVASSPPFFCGSPPSRVSNPLIQDARFGDDKFTPISPRSIPIPAELLSSPASSARKGGGGGGGGCVRANFGDNPAVRIEGFDCHRDRDRRNCSIPALA